MGKDYRKLSDDALTQINELSEKGIFWGMVFAVVVVVITMLKSMFVFG